MLITGTLPEHAERLAAGLGRPGEAAERARAGLALETQAGSKVWIKRTTGRLRQVGSVYPAAACENGRHARSREYPVR